MTKLSLEQAMRRVTILRLNIALGFLVLLASVALLISGDYSSLQERRAAEAVYNMMALGSMIYMALVWIACTLSKPLWHSDLLKRK